MGIKEKYAIRKLRKAEASVHRKPEIPDLDSLKKVGVIWQPEQKEAFSLFTGIFQQKTGLFSEVCVFLMKTLKWLPMQIQLFPKDLNWLGFPKPGKIENFTEMDFDLLLNIYFKPEYNSRLYYD